MLEESLIKTFAGIDPSLVRFFLTTFMFWYIWQTIKLSMRFSSVVFHLMDMSFDIYYKKGKYYKEKKRFDIYYKERKK